MVTRWFGVSEKNAKKWITRKITLEKLLNLAPSEDAVINHFIEPLLQNALGYTINDIDIKPYLTKNVGRKVKKMGGQGDIVTRKRGAPVFVIEAKSYGHKLKTATENAEGQAYDYTQANELKPRPKYYIATNVEETHIFETLTRKELQFSPILEGELLSKFVELERTLGRKNIFPLGAKTIQQQIKRIPITDLREFERILFTCQDEMRQASESKTGIVAFNEMNKLLFIKLNEDRREREGKENRFTCTKVFEEGENYIAGTLFRDIKDYYLKKNVDIFRAEDELKLDDVTVNRIVQKLEKIFLVDEQGGVYPPVAHVYENFVSTIFRGENGQYFTPRKIVDFMVNMVNLSWGSSGLTIVDPACGSGGFLLSCFSVLDSDLKSRFMKSSKGASWVFKNKKAEEEYNAAKKKLCEEMLLGFDNEEIVAKTAAMNMSVHGDGSTGINFGDSLRREATKSTLKENYFDLALTNPPFSSNVTRKSHIDIDGKDVLEGFDLAYRHQYNQEKNDYIFSRKEGNLRSRDSKILFIERCHQLLKKGGLLGIIVDDGVLNNPRESYVRAFIKRNFSIKAIIALPWGVFKEQDAENFTSILFLQKKAEGLIQAREIFMAVAKFCGENYGKSTRVMPNNLDNIRDDYKKFQRGELSGYSEFSFICDSSELLNYYDLETKRFNNRLDPKFYSPKRKAIEKMIEKTGKAQPIGEVVEFPKEEVKGDVNEFGSKYIDRITKSGDIGFSVINGVHDPKGKKTQIFRVNDLVVSRIQLKNGIVGIVPEALDEIRGTNEYYKVAPKVDDTTGKEKILRKYLRIVLTSEPIQYLLNATFTGQYGRIRDRDLSHVLIPVYDLDVQQEIIDKYESYRTKIVSLDAELEKKEKELITDVMSDIF